MAFWTQERDKNKSYFLFLKDTFDFYMKGREKERQRTRFSICWIATQMDAMAGAKPTQNQEAGASSRSPT